MPSASVPPPAEAIQPERVVDPDGWLVVVSWAVVVLSAAQIVLLSFGRDQGIYATVADGILRGQMPYRDVWDFKPPGSSWLYALAQAAFGKTMLAVRLVEVAGLVGMVFGFMRLTETFFGVRRVGVVGGAVAALIDAQLEFWHSGQPETFGGFLTVWSWRSPRARASAAAGCGGGWPSVRCSAARSCSSHRSRGRRPGLRGVPGPRSVGARGEVARRGAALRGGGARQPAASRAVRPLVQVTRRVGRALVDAVRVHARLHQARGGPTAAHPRCSTGGWKSCSSASRPWGPSASSLPS